MAKSKLFPCLTFTYWLAYLFCSPATVAGYSLVTSADSSNFFTLMNFVPSFANSDGIRDYTNGFVNYLTESVAFSTSLATTENGKVRLAVDNTTVLDQNLPVDGRNYGRDSVQVESRFTFDKGLLILDFTHMPPAVCGVWSAFWTINNVSSSPKTYCASTVLTQRKDADGSSSANTPLYAEIDVIEGVNNQPRNVVSLHTDRRETCSFNGNSAQTSTRGQSNCQLDDTNASGCEVEGPNGSYGADVNRLGGGIYSVEMKASSVKVWFIPRSSIPGDIFSGNPNPDNWQTPIAVYDAADGNCDIEKIFKTQTIVSPPFLFILSILGTTADKENKKVLNIDFCGDNGEATWSSGDNSCSKTNGLSSCNEYVAGNPKAFSETYWEINSLKLYQ
jgi:hypothetical protein